MAHDAATRPAAGTAERTGGVPFAVAYQRLESLAAADLPTRVSALEDLVRHPSRCIRDRAIAIGAEVVPEERLVAMLREEADDVARNAGLEMLKRRGKRSLARALTLLDDDDPDVVLQAVLVLDHVAADDAAPALLETATRATNPNVAHAAVVALGHGGDRGVVPSLLPLLDARPWLQIAAIEALGCLRAADAVKPLARLLDDPLLGDLALEALGRIGGRRVAALIVRRMLERPGGTETEGEMRCLAQARASIAARTPAREAILRRLRSRLHDDHRSVRLAAASCVVACGPSPCDGEAIVVLAGASEDEDGLPCGLACRPDLAGRLLAGPRRMAEWGHELVAREPRHVGDDALSMLLGSGDEVDLLLAGRTLARARRPALAAHLISAFLGSCGHARAALGVALRRHRSAVRGALDDRAGGTELDRLVLAAWLDLRPAATARAIAALPAALRSTLLPHLIGSRLAARLPWAAWLHDGEPVLPLVVAAAVAGPCPELAGLLREHVGADRLGIVRALGELRDPAAVAPLAAYLEESPTLERAVILDAIGRIGGADARAVLTSVLPTAEGGERRVAARALAACAGNAELPLLRDLCTDDDWPVRLAATHGLARSAAAEDRARLVLLASDPNPTVAGAAQDALSATPPGPQDRENER